MTPLVAHSDFLGKRECRQKQLGRLNAVAYNDNMLLRLKEIRKSMGLTQREVAERAGLSVSYYTELELGKKQLNQHRLTTISKALGRSPHEILVDETNARQAMLITKYGDLVEKIHSLPESNQVLVRQLIESLDDAADQQKS
jgi:transcriptional regulator with XRE-family HTH domain